MTKKIRPFMKYFHEEEDKALFQAVQQVQIDEDYSLAYRVTGAIEHWFIDHEEIEESIVFKLICTVFTVGYLQGGRAALDGKFKDPSPRKQPMQ